MTGRQKRVLAMLALADVMVVAGLIFSLADSGRLGARRAPAGWEPPHEACEWEATQRLAEAGLGGTVRLMPNGALRFEITYPPDAQEIPRFARNDKQDTDRGAGLAAQSVWTAFDIATECMRVSTPVSGPGALSNPDVLSGPLQEEECPTFTRVEVTILVHSTQIHASVRTPDLVALSTGELSEIEFIERVTYHFQR